MKRWLLAALPLALVLVPNGGALAAGGPRTTVPTVPNVNVDLDHGLAFSQNKQNEPSIARDPLTGALIAGANDELSQGPCVDTTTPHASPCPFTPGAPISAYYTSTDGSAWSGGYLPGFPSIGRVSGGDPSIDVGPSRCAAGGASGAACARSKAPCAPAAQVPMLSTSAIAIPNRSDRIHSSTRPPSPARTLHPITGDRT